MNKDQAIKQAQNAGFEIRKINTKEMFVGTKRIHHDSGGAACWKLDGKRIGYISETIIAAIK